VNQYLTSLFFLLLQLHLLIVNRVSEVLNCHDYFVLAIHVDLRLTEAYYLVYAVLNLDMELSRLLAHLKASQGLLHR